ncbi:uncharacterized protein P884DRAFT_259644 [Thermothelomyces heterothallicus CBS 202.75]|uniref:uncharacterized protein n=1 Tax=Thermothelomyces heterothallicus CBS 202.75 TaxID=1149848 RepID=UPI003742FE2B
MEPELVDIVIVGAGLSGINAAYRVQTLLPHHSYAILEARAEIGGTWAFWKYPGIRTDSSMGLFGFPWRPWPHEVSMAPGPAIKSYMEECAAAEGIDKKIRLGHRVVAMAWSSDEQCWTLQVEVRRGDINNNNSGAGEKKVIKAWWVIGASGYYSYERPLPAVIPGIERFGGQVVHPQFWDESVDYAGKKVVIIGSGATAVTLLPNLAKTAASVTMLQRTPSYVFGLPGTDKMVSRLARFMPLSWAQTLHWWRSMLLETVFTWLLTTFPNWGRRFITQEMRKQLPAHVDVDKHFNPWYNPFEQRLCFCPNNDFFKALHRPNARVVTDTIETVTETGIRLRSGAELEADMIVTATGLYFELLSGVDVTVDGESVTASFGRRYIWNGTMLEGVPNAGLITGYTAASWTPGADVRVRQLIKVIRHMDRTGAAAAAPYVDPRERASLPVRPAVGLSSTYMVSAHDRMPKVAGKAPWVNGANWATDVWRLFWSDVKQGMKYTFKGDKEKRV